MTNDQRRVWLITGASSGFGRAIAEAGALDSAKAEFAAWEHVGRSAVFDA
jgi:NADP-dependent 3-hydroxy acid dehydrogenase YdfG